MENRTYQFETLQLHAGQEQPDSATGARAVPIYQSTSFVFDNCAHAAARFALSDAGAIYSRLGNPTLDAFEARIAALEGGVAALSVASGAAAIDYTLRSLAHAGDHIVAAKTLYGGTYNALAHNLPESGITTTFVDPDEDSAFESAIQDNTKCIFIESIGNPNANLIDIRKVADIAHAHKIPLVIDSTFATPYLLRPIAYGADIVIHSATKFIGGHGTALGGVIVDSGNFDWEGSGKFPSLVAPNPSYHGLSFTKACGRAAFITKVRAITLRDCGATLAPLHAFLFLQGLETLSLRVERHVENTQRVVSFLQKHSRITRVNHPSLPESPYHALYQEYFPRGGASIFTIEVGETSQDAQAFIDHLKIFSLLANVADAKSLVIHPASTTHGQMSESELLDAGIRPNTVRLSIGLEHIDDILWDLAQALDSLERN